MTPHHQAIRLQAVRAALHAWCPTLVDQITESEAPQAGSQTPAEENLDTLDSGSEPFRTISQEKMARSVA